MTEEGFDRLVNVHFKGVYFLTQKLLPYIADGGRIVNTSSGLARFSVPGYSAYGALKGAIEVLTRYMAKELGHRKISANVVAPGVVETDFTRRALSDEKMKSHLEANTALGRVGQPEEHRRSRHLPLLRRSPLGQRPTSRSLRRHVSIKMVPSSRASVS